MIKLLLTSYIVLITVNRKHFVQAQTLNPPLNAAANVGDRVVINCTTGASMIPQWRYSPTGTGSFTPISYTGSCVSLIPIRFVVESTGNGNCNLIIPSATTAEALVYQCLDGAAFDHYMLLTIIESIKVSPNSAAQELCPYDPLNITCSVRYSSVSTQGLQMFPSIMWTNLSANANISGTDVTSSNVITSYLSIATSPPTVPPYSCNVYFNAPSNTTDFATNAPNYYNSTKTQELIAQCIKLNASSITVTSCNESDSCEAKILECKPYAYPPPHDVHWLDVIRNEVVNGTRITGEFGGEYVCSVTNAVKTVTVTYKLNDDGAFTIDECKGVSEVNITVSGNNPSEMYAAKTSNKINLQSSEKATEITIENATEVIITCTADGLPNPSYIWNEPCNTKPSHQQLLANASGSYECEASNLICDRMFSKSITIHVNLPSAAPLKCADAKPGPLPDDGLEWLLLLILLLLVFLLPACVFLLYYGLSKSCRGNVNDEFPWIEKALPCMNGKGCECSGGMVLFIFCLVICGLVFVPWILIASHCCQKNSKKSQGDISLRERNGSTGSHRQSRSSSTGAPSQPPPERPAPVGPYHNSHAHTDYPQSTSNRSMHSPSPVSASGVEYGELRIDAKPGSRKPIELIVQKESAYAELQKS